MYRIYPSVENSTVKCPLTKIKFQIDQSVVSIPNEIKWNLIVRMGERNKGDENQHEMNVKNEKSKLKPKPSVKMLNRRKQKKKRRRRQKRRC